MSATSVGVGRLLLWETAAVGVRSSVGVRVGRWESDGEWVADRDFSSVEVRPELWTLVRVVDRLSVSARAPFVVTHVASGEMSDTGGGLGDVSLGLLMEPIRAGEHRGVPGVQLEFGVTLPTGRNPDEASSSLLADVTARGGATLSLGTSVEYVRIPWFVRVDAGGAAPLARDRDGGRQRLGPRWTAALIVGGEVGRGVVLSGLVHGSAEAAIVRGNQAVPDSEASDVGVGMTVSWRFDDEWSVQAGVDTGLFLAGLGDNREGRVTATLGLRYGFIE